MSTWLTWAAGLVFLMAGCSLSVDAKQPRSQAAKDEFVKLVACPSTGQHALPCIGYIVDHIYPLCFGGADAANNMMWMNAADAKKKDVFEVQACALKRKCGP